MHRKFFYGLAACTLFTATALAAGPTALTPPPDRLDALAEMFKNPPMDFRIQFLMRTNDEVSKEEMDFQARSIREQGGGGMFSYCEYMDGGSPQKFMSDWWMNVVDITAKACADAGIMYWAYDEQDWPSGSVGGQLLEQHPEYRWKYMKERTHTFKGGEQADIKATADKEEIFVAAVAYRMRDGKIVLDTLTDLSDRVQDGAIKWEVPEGEWTISTYVAITSSWGWSNLPTPDLMDSRVCDAFIDWVYKGHYDRISQLPGTKLVGYFTDEPSMTVALYPGGEQFTWHPSMPWTPELNKAFTSETGIEFRKNLPLLYHDSGPESMKYRCRFWETCAALYRDNYFGKIYKFCEQRGLLSSGHIHVEESLLAHLTLQGGNVLDIYRNMHVPGIDWIFPYNNELPATTPKYATSAAHLMGRDRAWCESFAGCGWGLPMQDIRHFVNWEHVNGINMQVPICYKYSLRGHKRTAFYNPGISYQQPYWDHFRGFADYEARMCLLTAGQGHVAQVALFYPAVDMWSHCWNQDVLAKRTPVYNEIANRIRAGGYDFDILDDRAILDEVKIDSGQLHSKTETYQALVCPEMDTVRRETFARVADFVRQGGKLTFVGNLPRHSYEDGNDDPKLARLVQELLGEKCYEQVKTGKPFTNKLGNGQAGFAPAPADGISMLWEMLPPDLTASPRTNDVYGYHRHLADGELYMLFNRKDETRTFDITVRSKGHPEQWDAMAGTIHEVGEFETVSEGTRLKLKFAPYEMIVVVLRADASSPKRLPALPQTLVKEIPIAGPFKFRVEQTMSRPNIAWNFRQMEDGWKAATQPAIPEKLPTGDWTRLGLPYFSGIGHYETRVQVDAVPTGTRAILDLGRVAVTAEVFVNGKSAGLVFFAPYCIDITDLLEPGSNDLRIAVANTLVNYYSQFKELEKAALYNAGIEPKHKTSGLLGPVALQFMK